MKRKIGYFLKRCIPILVLICMVFSFSAFGEGESYGNTAVIEIKDEIDRGTAEYVKRAINDAREAEADAILFEIDTPGGEIDSAKEISNQILSAGVPTVAYINKDAMSAGVLLSISCDKIIMAPGSSIGAAEPRPNDEKYVSAWTKDLSKVAEINGRDKKIVEAMADANIEIEGIIEKGKILTLTTEEALALNFIDGSARTMEEALQLAGYPANTLDLSPNRVERLAHFITTPLVSSALLTIGFIAIIAEIFIAGFGLAGIVGILCFALYFFGHLIAGFATYTVVIIFIVGILLLIAEAFIPGFGVCGITGIIAIVASIFMSSVSALQAVISLLCAIIGTGVFLAVMLKFFPKSKLVTRLILSDKIGNKEAENAFAERKHLEGKIGIAYTLLRPAGVAMIEGKRYDVITEGDFIQKEEEIVVEKVEGSKIIVKKSEK